MAAENEKYDLGHGNTYENGKFYVDGVDASTKYKEGDFRLGMLQSALENARANATKTKGYELASKQTALADEFAANVPKYTGLLQDQSRKTIQRTIAENIQGLKQRSSTAGFLGGSGTQKQQAETLASGATDIMSKDAAIKSDIEAQAQQFKNQALANAMSMQGSANQATIDQLRQNILDQQRQSELWRSLGGAVGQGVGAYYGNKSGGNSGSNTSGG